MSYSTQQRCLCYGSSVGDKHCAICLSQQLPNERHSKSWRVPPVVPVLEHLEIQRVEGCNNAVARKNIEVARELENEEDSDINFCHVAAYITFDAPAAKLQTSESGPLATVATQLLFKTLSTTNTGV